jgi:hypothetical protein
VELVLTPEHPVYVPSDGWVPAGMLQIGNCVQTRAGPAEVVSLDLVTGSFPVYNLEVSDTHTYFVTSALVWVHNGCGPPRPPKPWNMTPGGNPGWYVGPQPPHTGLRFGPGGKIVGGRTYDALGYAVSDTDVGSVSGIIRDRLPYVHPMKWPKGQRFPGGSPARLREPVFDPIPMPDHSRWCGSVCHADNGMAEQAASRPRPGSASPLRVARNRALMSNCAWTSGGWRQSVL